VAPERMHQLLLERGPLQLHLTYLFGHHITDFFHEVFYDILGQWLFLGNVCYYTNRKGGGGLAWGGWENMFFPAINSLF